MNNNESITSLAVDETQSKEGVPIYASLLDRALLNVDGIIYREEPDLFDEAFQSAVFSDPRFVSARANIFNARGILLRHYNDMNRYDGGVHEVLDIYSGLYIALGGQIGDEHELSLLRCYNAGLSFLANSCTSSDINYNYSGGLSRRFGNLDPQLRPVRYNEKRELYLSDAVSSISKADNPLSANPSIVSDRRVVKLPFGQKKVYSIVDTDRSGVIQKAFEQSASLAGVPVRIITNLSGYKYRYPIENLLIKMAEIYQCSPSIKPDFPSSADKIFQTFEILYELDLLDDEFFRPMKATLVKNLASLYNEPKKTLAGVVFDDSKFSHFALTKSDKWRDIMDEVKRQKAISRRENITQDNPPRDVQGKLKSYKMSFRRYQGRLGKDTANSKTGPVLRGVSTIRDASIRANSFVQNRNHALGRAEADKEHIDILKGEVTAYINEISEKDSKLFDNNMFLPVVFATRMKNLAGLYASNKRFEFSKKAQVLLKDISSGLYDEQLLEFSEHPSASSRFIGVFDLAAANSYATHESIVLAQRLSMQSLLKILGDRSDNSLDLDFLLADISPYDEYLSYGFAHQLESKSFITALKKRRPSAKPRKRLTKDSIYVFPEKIKEPTFKERMRNNAIIHYPLLRNIAYAGIATLGVMGAVNVAKQLPRDFEVKPFSIDINDSAASTMIDKAFDVMRKFGVEPNFAFLNFRSLEIIKNERTQLIGAVPDAKFKNLPEGQNYWPIGFLPNPRIERLSSDSVFAGETGKPSDSNKSYNPDSDMRFILPPGQTSFIPPVGYYVVGFFADDVDSALVKVSVDGKGIYYDGHGEGLVLLRPFDADRDVFKSGYNAVSKMPELHDKYELKVDSEGLNDIIDVAPDGDFKELLRASRDIFYSDISDHEKSIAIINSYLEYTKTGHYALFPNFENKSEVATGKYRNLLNIGMNPDEGYYCELADMSFREYLSLFGINSRSVFGTLPKVDVSSGKVYAKSGHVVTEVLVPTKDGQGSEVYAIDTTPGTSDKTPKEDIDALMINPKDVKPISASDRNIVEMLKDSKFAEYVSVYGLRYGLPLLALLSASSLAFVYAKNRQGRRVGGEAEQQEKVQAVNEVEAVPPQIEMILGLVQDGYTTPEINFLTTISNFIARSSSKDVLDISLDVISSVPRDSFGLINSFADPKRNSEMDLWILDEEVFSTGAEKLADYIALEIRKRSDLRYLIPHALEDEFYKFSRGEIKFLELSKESRAIIDSASVMYVSAQESRIADLIAQLNSSMGVSYGGDKFDPNIHGSSLDREYFESSIAEVLLGEGLGKQNKKYLETVKRLLK